MDITRQHHAEDLDPHCRPPGLLAGELTGAGWHRLVVLGDSIAEGLGDPVAGYRDLSWADRLAEVMDLAAGPVAYRNLGVRGLRAREIRRRQLDDALAFRADVAVVCAGANDILGRTFEPDRLRGELDAIVAPLAATGCVVVTFGLLDLSRTSFVPDELRAGLRDRLERLNAVTLSVTRRYRGVHVDFFDHPALGDALFSADRLHPNRRGHACIATSVVEALAMRHRRAGLAGVAGGPGRAGPAFAGRVLVTS
jgi:lysophospholipase L1-like esterase